MPRSFRGSAFLFAALIPASSGMYGGYPLPFLPFGIGVRTFLRAYPYCLEVLGNSLTLGGYYTIKGFFGEQAEIPAPRREKGAARGILFSYYLASYLFPMHPDESLSAQGSFAPFVLVAFAFLLPFFFVPDALFPFQFSKTVLALVAAVAIFIAFAMRTLRSGILSFRWSSILTGAVGLTFVYLLSSFFSSTSSLSFFGYQLDPDTFGFIALGAALMFATTLAVDTEERIFRIFLALLAGAWVVFLFQLIQVLFGVPIHLGIFTTPIQNLLGKWNDFSLFAGLFAALALVSLEALSLSVLGASVLGATLAVSLFFLALANFPLAWYILGAVSFATLVFSFMRRHVSEDAAPLKSRGVVSCIVLAVVVFFVFFGSPVSLALQNHFNIQALEVSPSVGGTLGIVGNVFSKNPVFGSGPDTFVNDWFLARPASTLGTVFWSTEFSAGFGFIPSTLATGGIVVGIGWLLLIGLFLWVGVRALVRVSAEGSRAYFLIVLSALASAILFVMHLWYVPSASLSLMLFLFLGLFIASLGRTSFVRNVVVRFSESPRLGFVSVLAIAVLIVGSLVALYGTGEVYASAVTEANAVSLGNAGDTAGALAAGREAVSLAPLDVYYRTLTSLDLASLASTTQNGKNDVATQQAIQSALSDAITNASAAIALNPESFDNWMNRAAVYEAAVPLSIQGAADSATAALEEARKRNPNTPEVDYQEASLKEFAKDDAGAKTAAEAAIAKKADYTPAILLLAQISLNQGNLAEAISSLKSAIVFTPNDSSLLYQLGLLELQAKEYSDAADAFNQALTITPDYQNAMFYLGAADVYLGKKDEALALFGELLDKNPGNAVLTDVISKLGSGKNPFENGTALPPGTETPAAG